MKDGIAILSFIAIGMLWPTWLQHRVRGWTFLTIWVAPIVAFCLGWLAK